MATTNHVKGCIGVLMTRILASIGEPSVDTSNPKRPGAPVLSSFVFLDTTGRHPHHWPLRAGAYQYHRGHRRMNLVLHGVSDFDIRSGNTLHDPALIERDRLKTFDVVLANPPYSIKKWNREAWQSDDWGRNFLGTPTQGRADYAFFP